MSLATFRSHLYEALENPNSNRGKLVEYCILSLIGLSIVGLMIETTSGAQPYLTYFEQFDFIIMIIFAIELGLRWWVSPDQKVFWRSGFNWIDFIVVVAYFIAFNNLAFFRSLRAIRVLKILKVVRYSHLARTFFRSFSGYKEELKIFFTTLLLVVTLGSFGMYYAESGSNPQFSSIPESLWWTIVTVSTVGYGDMVPITLSGRLLGGVIIILGVATMAILTAMVTKTFIDHIFGKRRFNCPFCHFPHHDHDAKFCKNCGGGLEGTG